MERIAKNRPVEQSHDVDLRSVNKFGTQRSRLNTHYVSIVMKHARIQTCVYNYSAERVEREQFTVEPNASPHAHKTNFITVRPDPPEAQLSRIGSGRKL
jgi:hypothetical protein